MPADPTEEPATPYASVDTDSSTTDTGDGNRRKRRSPYPLWVELPALVVIALLVAVVVKTFLVQAFFIPSGSMRDTLVENDRVMVNKLAYRFGEPAQGHVIVFDSPVAIGNDGESLIEAVVRNIGESLGLVTPDTALIKRIVAVGGQTVEIRDGSLLVDGRAVDEPYLRPGVRMDDFAAGTEGAPPRCPVGTSPDVPSGCVVDAGHVFVLGDNRSASEDSRRFGAIPEGSIIGRAFIRVWPPSRWGGL